MNNLSIFADEQLKKPRFSYEEGLLSSIQKAINLLLELLNKVAHKSYGTGVSERLFDSMKFPDS